MRFLVGVFDQNWSQVMSRLEAGEPIVELLSWTTLIRRTTGISLAHGYFLETKIAIVLIRNSLHHGNTGSDGSLAINWR